MADIEQKIIIVRGDHRVTSEVTHDEKNGCYRVMSTCCDDATGAVQKFINVLHGVGYSPEQLQYDVELARHEMADEVSGKHHVSVLLPTALKTTTGDPKEVSAPRYPKPGPTGKPTRI